MQISICDDNPQIISQLQVLLQKYFKEKQLSLPDITTFSSGEDLLNNSSAKDIVFLDIEMPGCDGIFVGNTLKQKWPNTIIIVVTSYSEYLDDFMCFVIYPSQLMKHDFSAIWMTPYIYITQTTIKLPSKQKRA